MGGAVYWLNTGNWYNRLTEIMISLNYSRGLKIYKRLSPKCRFRLLPMTTWCGLPPKRVQCPLGCFHGVIWNFQCTLKTVAIRVEALVHGCYEVFRKTHPYMDSCYTTWKSYIVPNAQPSRLSSSVSVSRYLSAFSACLLQVLCAGTSWKGYMPIREAEGDLRLRFLICCSQQKNQNHPCLPWWSFPSYRAHNRTVLPYMVPIPLL